MLPFIGEWAAELSEHWATDPPDLVHAFGWLGGLAAQLAARRHQLPVIQSFYGLAAEPGADVTEVERARIEPLLVRGATWVTGSSTDEIDALTRLRRRRARLSVLSCGIDVARYAPTGPREPETGVFRILQLAPNCLPRHGFDRTIRTLPKLPGTELVIAETGLSGGSGNGPRAALQKLAAELGVSERVRFVGAVVAEELPLLLQSAHVVACTPRQAPRATAALQAMASGVVVVGVAIDALTDIVINGVTGLLVSASNPHELAFALKALQTQRFQRDSMGSAGRSRAVSRFNWDRVALDALSIYQQATAPPVPQKPRARLGTTA